MIVDAHPVEGMGNRMHTILIKVDGDWEFKKELLFNKLVEFGVKKEDALEELNKIRNKGRYEVEDDKGNMFFIEPV